MEGVEETDPMKNRYGTWVCALVLASSGVVSSGAAAEERTAKNSIFAEGLGPGLAYSLNYERLVANDVGVRAGLSYMTFSSSASAGGTTASSSSTWMSFPLTASYIGLASGPSALELGGGMTLVYTSASAEGLGASASGSGVAPYADVLVGYRLQPLDGGFQFRVGFTGLIGKGLGFNVTDPDAIGFLPWAHISFGGTF
jgi:hypothetical protein